MAKRVLVERFAMGAGARVDRTGPRPVVRGVLLLGATSANRRRYRDEATAGERVKRYEGVWVYMNHGRGSEPRRYEDRLARVINPRHRSDGRPVGDLEVRPKHPMAEQFLWDAENDPTSIGMSHVAHCETVTARDGWEEITEVSKVDSVDIVTDPATTRGLFEHRNRRTTKLSMHLVRILASKSASAAAKRAARVLREEAPADVEVPAEMRMGDMDAEAVNAALEQGYEAALAALVKGALSKDPAAVARKVEKLIRAYQAATRDSDGDGEPDAVEGRGRKRVTWSGDTAPAGAAAFAESLRAPRCDPDRLAAFVKSLRD